MTPKAKSAASLRKRAEAILKKQPAPAVPGDPQQLLHDLRVHQIELETQNEELRWTQVALTAAQERYFDLYDLAPVGYFTVNKNGIITEVNLAACTLLGMTKPLLLKHPFAHFICAEDTDSFHQYRQQLLERHAASAREAQPPLASGDLRLKKADGAFVWVQLHGAITKDTAGEPSFCIVVADLTVRKQAEQAQISLTEKEVLLKEIHHRVKNNLQIICSLVSLQADTLTDDHCRTQLAEVRDRIRAMAFVHEALYQTDNLAKLDFADYANRLVHYLSEIHRGTIGAVELKLAIPSVLLPVDQAVNCGLILNELATNALKYAFPDNRPGTVTVAMEHNSATGTICLRVQDDGIGLPAGLDWQQTKSLGLRLVHMLGGQLHGTVEVGPGPGTEFRISFKLP